MSSSVDLLPAQLGGSACKVNVDYIEGALDELIGTIEEKVTLFVLGRQW